MSSLTSFDTPRSSSGPIIGVIPLRLGAGFVLLYMHAWAQTQVAYNALWHGQPWDLINLLKNAGLPMPRVLAIAAALITAAVAMSWLLGFLTRLFSALFIPVTIGSLLICNRNDRPDGAESALLFFFISITLVIFGSGWLSLDSLFGRKRARKKSSRYV